MPVDLSELNFDDFPLFHNAEPDIVRKLIAAGFRFQYEAGTPMISNNDLGETFFLILHGLAKLVLVNNRNEEISITLFKAGDFFGELAILEPKPTRSANVISVTPIDVVAVQKKEFLKLVEQYPVLALNIARVLGQRLRAMNERMTTERLNDHLARVAHTLLHLAKKGQAFNEQGTVLLPSLSLKEWALFCYTTTDGFMNGIEKLKQAGAIEWQSQRIVITNMEALRRNAEVHAIPVPGGPTTSQHL